MTRRPKRSHAADHRRNRANAKRTALRSSDRPSTVVLKLGGELLEQPEDVARVAKGIRGLAARARLTVVHGGGKEIDAALAAAGIPKRQVDGLRVTDEATLAVVVSVLAGTLNTRLVAGARRAGAKAVGLTAADAGVAVMRKASPIVSTQGERVDLGLVGTPTGASKPALLNSLMDAGFVPVVACVGATGRGDVLNVNADTLASHVAIGLGATRLVIAGGTAGVLDAQQQTIPRVTAADATRLIREGTANKGMVAKLQACRDAVRRGVGDVVIGDGRTLNFVKLGNAQATPGGCTQVVR